MSGDLGLSSRGDLRLNRRFSWRWGGGPDRVRPCPATMGQAGYAWGATLRWFLFWNVPS